MSREQYYDVIRRPVITEKSTLASEFNQVVFRVSLDADKKTIKEAMKMLNPASNCTCQNERKSTRGVHPRPATLLLPWKPGTRLS